MTNGTKIELYEHHAWDSPTRIFHWVNVACVVGLIALGTIILNGGRLGLSSSGKLAVKEIHVYIGYVFSLNLLWRLIWGFIGGHHSRWRSILPGGRRFLMAVRSEIDALRRGKVVQYVGHTPLGRLAVTAMLLILVGQSLSGIFLAGANIYMGPFGEFFADMVKAPGLIAEQVRPYAPETVDAAAFERLRDIRRPITELHEIFYYLIVGLAMLHILAVSLKEVFHGGGLVSAMFTGRKFLSERPSDDN